MVAPAKRRQDEYQAFYTYCNHITNYMVDLLDCHDGMSVLEPCAGDGAFLDELLRLGKDIKLTALELNAISVAGLKKKYSNCKNISILESDFTVEDINAHHDRVIANPPYGAFQTPEKRKVLKDKYADLYAKETYGVFLIRAMESLKPGGRLVFIIPDTFLTLHMHEGLRKRLLHYYKVESITLFPSKFFPGVNFGYAGLSIISVLNEAPLYDWTFPVISGLSSNESFSDLANAKSTFESCQLNYQQLKYNPSFSFYLSQDKWVTTILGSYLPVIDSICHVVTGFYSGNDSLHLKRAKSVTRGLEKYSEVDLDKVNLESFTTNPPLDGISGQKHWVPIVKGGNRRFFKPSEWFMDWSTEAVHIYKVLNKKKARFQNSQFYFKQGIAVPMVSSSAITGALIQNRLFDQSIVGIFLKDEHQHLLHYLLGFFNSDVCNKLIRTINASSNNSSNYIKKIPIVIPDNNIVASINSIVVKLTDLAIERDIVASDLEEMNKIFNTMYQV